MFVPTIKWCWVLPLTGHRVWRLAVCGFDSPRPRISAASHHRRAALASVEAVRLLNRFMPAWEANLHPAQWSFAALKLIIRRYLAGEATACTWSESNAWTIANPPVFLRQPGFFPHLDRRGPQEMVRCSGVGPQS